MVTLSFFDGLSHTERLDYLRANRNEFVGRVLIGVLSTGIYCLPSCTAREPKAENVRFYRTEAEAQADGLRACRRCHPDHFYRNYNPDLECLTNTVKAVYSNPGAFASVDDMLNATSIGTTKLHALFRQHYHTTPAAYLSRTRIAAACRLLADLHCQVADVAYSVGYESLSAFHDNFRKATGLSPSDYQHLGSDFTLSVPENYLPWVALKLLARDPDSRIERVDGHHAVKALVVGSQTAVVHLDFHGQRVACRVESARALDRSTLHDIHSTILRMLGFGMNPAPFERQIAGTPDLARLIEGRAGLRIAQSADVFEGITWAIVGQQVNLAFAFKLRRALAELCGQEVGEGLYAHPTPERVAALDYTDLTARQYARKKAEYLIDTARLVVSGDLVIDPQASATEIEKRLHAVRGLGPWSVNYIMMRALGFADCVPLGDTGLSTGLQRFFALDHRPGADEVSQLMEPFAPFRSLATYHLWMSLGVNPA